MTTYEPRLDREHITRAANWTALELREHRVARVILTPGDMTRYPILIASPWWEWIERRDRTTSTQLGHDYWVALLDHAVGAGYPWNGQEVHPLYAAEKWGRFDLPTGHVMAGFLNALAEALTS
jgi:hypothetical protein